MYSWVGMAVENINVCSWYPGVGTVVFLVSFSVLILIKKLSNVPHTVYSPESVLLCVCVSMCLDPCVNYTDCISLHTWFTKRQLSVLATSRGQIRNQEAVL